jgi:hypothetical protein
MKRRYAILAALIILPLGLWLVAQTIQPTANPSNYFPPGPALYIETRDLTALLGNWSASSEKRDWLVSDNYSVFSRSRLFLRLQEAQNEFTQAAGLAPDMDLVNSVAGHESGLAIYSIGKLEFLYITQLASAKAIETALWKTRSTYDARSSAGQQYFVHSDPQSKRTAAFAANNGWLLLSTREDLIAGALALLSGQKNPSLSAENWFDAAVKASKQQGEIRIALNMPVLVRSPHFRSYWIQGNVNQLKEYNAGIVDVFREANQIREERVLLRQQPGPSMATKESATGFLDMIPANAGLYRAWVAPPAKDAADLVYRKLLAPASDGQVQSRYAPQAADPDAIAGSEADLETRIDEPPLDLGDKKEDYNRLLAFLEKTPLDAMAEVQSSAVQTGGIFVTNPRAILLLGTTAWNLGAVRAVTGKTSMRVNGRVLVLADSDAMLNSIRNGGQPIAGGTYVAVYRHAQELGNYTKLMTMLDYTRPAEGGGQREPQLYSQNVASLGRALGRVESASITVHDTGAAVPQTVIYRFRP